MSIQTGLFTNDYVDFTAKRHGGAKTSNAANVKAAPRKGHWREAIRGFIRMKGTATLEDACEYFDRPANKISGRISEMLARGEIERTGAVVNGFAVYRIKI